MSKCKNVFVFISFVPLFLSSCQFLASPLGEKLIIDSAQEVIELENEFKQPSPEQTETKQIQTNHHDKTKP